MQGTGYNSVRRSEGTRRKKGDSQRSEASGRLLCAIRVVAEVSSGCPGIVALPWLLESRTHHTSVASVAAATTAPAPVRGRTSVLVSCLLVSYQITGGT